MTRDRDWIVPVGIKDRYWDATFYAAGYPSAKEAEESVRVLCEQLPAVLGAKFVAGEFVIGPAVPLKP